MLVVSTKIETEFLKTIKRLKRKERTAVLNYCIEILENVEADEGYIDDLKGERKCLKAMESG